MWAEEDKTVVLSSDDDEIIDLCSDAEEEQQKLSQSSSLGGRSSSNSGRTTSLQSVNDHSMPAQPIAPLGASVGTVGTAGRIADKKCSAIEKVDKAEKQRLKRAKKEEENVQKELRKKNEKELKGDYWYGEIALIFGANNVLQHQIVEMLTKGWENGDLQKETLTISSFVDPVCSTAGLYRWTYRRYLDGGACNVRTLNNGQKKYRVLEVALIVFPPQLFLQLSLQDGDYINFPSLRTHFQNLMQFLHIAEECPKNTRVILVLECLERHYTKLINAAAKSAALASNKLTGLELANVSMEAIAFLSFEFPIEVKRVKEEKEISRQLVTLTRGLGRAIYKKPITNADCIQKKAVDKDATGDDALRIVWVNMLQQLNGMSSEKANMMVDDPRYACPKMLHETLTGPGMPPDKRKDTLAEAFGPRKSHKLADSVYRIMTSAEPGQLMP